MADPSVEPSTKDPGADTLKILMILPAYRLWTDPALPEEIRKWVEHDANNQELMTLGAIVLERIASLD